MVLEEDIMKDIRTYIKHLILEMHQDQSMMIPPPPAETIEELNQVIHQYHNRLNPASLQYDLDERMELLFNDVVQEYYGDNVIAKVKELKKHLLPIVDQLKKHFKRERPEDVATNFGINWKSDSVDMNTINNSYSYPSGHTAQAYYVAHNLCDKYPEAKNELMNVAEAVAQSRIDRGVHFPSDLDAGRTLASKMYHENKNSHVMTEGMTSPNSVAGKYAIWASISAFDAQNEEILGEVDFLMYDWSAAEEQIQQLLGKGQTPEDILGNGEPLLAISNNAVACMRVRPYAENAGCNSAWEVIRSAADSGLGPTIYDMVMSIAPYGLIADRSQVSSDARKVWSYYANNRSSIDKDFLDPSGYTDTEWDDCDVHGGRVDPLRTATRLMAVEYFDSTWPYEHEIFKEKAEMYDIMVAGGSDGDRYFEIVSKWIEENQADHDIDEWNIDEANDSWYDWKTEGELELMDKLDNDFKFEDPDYLNLSYNTRYAVDSYKEMQENHYAFINSLEEMVPGSEESIYEDEYALYFAVRDFFNERA